MSLGLCVALLRPLARRHTRSARWLAEALVTRSQVVGIGRDDLSRRTAAADEAVTLYRRLVRSRPGRYETGLARALVAQGGVPDDRTAASAVAQGREAIGYVEDATGRAALAVLAGARLLVARNLAAADAVSDALPLAEQARATWLRCAPFGTRERVGLIRSLLVVGECRAMLDMPAEALAVHEEAMALFRRLSPLVRLRWMPVRLAAATGLAASLADVGRWDDALAVADGSRDDLVFWARWEPRRGGMLLGRLLTVIAWCRLGRDEPDLARAAAEEAVERWRTLDSARRRGGLTYALATLAAVLRHQGRLAEAAERLDDAVRAARGVDDAALASALLDLADLRMALDDGAGARTAFVEAVPLCRRYAGERSGRWSPRLASALAMVCLLTALGPEEPDTTTATEALVAGRESVELARALADGDPAYRALVAANLAALERMVVRTGDPRGSAELLRECVAIRRDLFRADPATYRGDLAQALGNLGNRLHVLDRLAEALDAHRECVELLRAGGGSERRELPQALRNLGHTLLRLGDHDAVERVVDEIEALDADSPGR